MLHLLPPKPTKSDILDFLEGKIYGEDEINADLSTSTALALKSSGKHVKDEGGEVYDLVSSDDDGDN